MVACFGVAGAKAFGADERWQGRIQMGGMEIGFLTTFNSDGDAWTATIDIPLQGVSGDRLSDVAFGDPDIKFTYQPKGAPFVAIFTAKRGEDKATAAGEIDQAGMKFPIQMERLAPDETPDFGLKRPQTPQPPFPYHCEDVTYRNDADGVTLAGTLTIPKGDGPHPVAILVTGSGPQDRDETIVGHKPFLVIADHLTRNGVAVLRVDDRGMGGSSGSVMESTPEAFGRDLSAGVDFLKHHSRIDGARIGLIGHSEGGIVAPMVAARSGDVAFVVMLAGTGLPGNEVLATQLAAILRASGMGAELVDQQVVVQQRLIAAALAGDDETALRDATRELIALQRGVTIDQVPADDSLVAIQVEQMKSPWFQSFLGLDPRPALRQLRCPVLVLNGSLDLQVLPKENLDAIRAALAEAPTKDTQVLELAGLNHLFQEARTGLPAEYAQIEQTISPRALDAMTTWIQERVGR